MFAFGYNRFGNVVWLLFVAVRITSSSALLWRDVAHFYPEKPDREKLNQGFLGKVPVETALRANCTLDRFSQDDLAISGYNCKSVPPIDKPWNVTNLHVYGTSIANISGGVFSECRIRSLRFTQTHLSTLGADSFVGLEQLETLTIHENPLWRIHSDAFKGLDRLRSVTLSRTRISQLSAVVPALSHVRRLEFFDLAFNLISSVGEDDLTPLKHSSLKHLSLTGCLSLTFIHPRAFSQLRSLEGLSLRDNINLVNSESRFDELLQVVGNLSQPSLKILDLTHLTVLGASKQLYTEIAKTSVEILVLTTPKLDVSNRTFPLMERISSLVIPAIDTTVGKGDLDSFPNLREIVFGPWYTAEFSEGLALPQLEHLELFGSTKRRQVLALRPGVFRTMTKLKSLSLRYKAIPDLFRNTFDGLSSLLELDIAFCRISRLPDGVFEPLRALEKLDLTGNTMLSLDSGKVFAPLRRLKYLSLALTGTNWLAEESLSQLVALEHLRLNNNSLSIIPDLKANANLRTMDLSANRFTFFEEFQSDNGSYYNRLPDSVESLDLSHNAIVYGVRLPDGVRYLNVSNNPYRCECPIRSLLSILSEPRIELFNREFKTAYQCAQPNSLRGAHILSVAGLLEKSCQPLLLMAIALLSLGVLIAVVLLIAAVVYKHRFENWLENYAVNKRPVGTRRKFTFDAFVSYSTHDVHFVLHDLLPRLESLKKLKLCVYDRDFLAGKSITDCVIDSMKESRKIIIVLSNHFLTSPWCKFETDLAQYTMLEENRDALIILKIAVLDETRLDSRLSYLLKTRVHLDYCTMPRDLFFDKLIDAVREDRPSYQRLRRNLREFSRLRALKKCALPPAQLPSVHRELDTAAVNFRIPNGEAKRRPYETEQNRQAEI